MRNSTPFLALIDPNEEKWAGSVICRQKKKIPRHDVMNAKKLRKARGDGRSTRDLPSWRRLLPYSNNHYFYFYLQLQQSP